MFIKNSSHIKKSKKSGSPAGTLLYLGEERSDKVLIPTYKFSQLTCEEKHSVSIEEIKNISLNDDEYVWIEVDGVHDVEIVRAIGEHFKIHPLLLEDIVTTGQRPKREEHEDLLAIFVQMARFCKEETTHKSKIAFQQVSFILTNKVLISFQEGEKDTFDSARKRLHADKSNVRRQGTDFLLYLLLDSIVDSYYLILEEFGEVLDTLEAELVSAADQNTLKKIYNTKRIIIALRRASWPLRELLNGLLRSENPFIKKENGIYYSDVYDHVVEILDMVENAREIASGMVDVYLSSISNRLNEVMRVLTVITTIFMPLTFIAGVYGMNFDYMPELRWHYGYLVVLAIMLSIAGGMTYYFKRKKWL